MKGNSTLAAVAAAMMAGLGGTPLAMSDANHAAAYHLPRRHYGGQRARHLTKAGPGRSGHKGRSRHAKRHTGRIHRGSGHRNLRKLLGTR